jgi:hypothetical protein
MDNEEGDATVKRPDEPITYPIRDQYLKRLDENAAAQRAQVAAWENTVNARFFDPRRAQILAMFDMLDDNGKNEAVEWVGKALAKQQNNGTM